MCYRSYWTQQQRELDQQDGMSGLIWLVIYFSDDGDRWKRIGKRAFQ
jgi:hypothetical protein